ncbi:hypothetical protein O983_02755 [Mycobacterium avium 09-5983]|nr:hypothetical protein O983_02755 [Mycobacterium avium 09-5983]
MTSVPVHDQSARMDLVFSLAERWNPDGEFAGIGGRVEFRTDVFDAATIETLIERLRRVLEAMTGDPGRPLSAVDLLDDAERAYLEEVGNTAILTRPASGRVSVPELFATQVARVPETVALVCDDLSVTYRQLDEASNRLAHRLAAAGAGPGQTVALLFSRSAEAVAAILAVLKTGAAYLPIDPSAPQTRVEFMLGDAEPIAAVTTAELAQRLAGRPVTVVDVDDPGIDTLPDTALPLPDPDARPRGHAHRHPADRGDRFPGPVPAEQPVGADALHGARAGPGHRPRARAGPHRRLAAQGPAVDTGAGSRGARPGAGDLR